MATAPPDQKARDDARLSLSANAVVEAGAGTGKTTLLTDRILFLLLGGPGGKAVPIHEIVALTFTEKAAGEIKLRLSDRLAEIASNAKTERAERTLSELASVFKVGREAAVERAQAALADLDKAQIGTIHSFAAHLLRLYPVQAGVDPGFTVDEGEGFEELFASEWARWLDLELGEKPLREKDWLELLAHCELEELEELARELCSEKLELERAGLPDPAAAEWARGLARALDALAKSQPAPKGKSRMPSDLAALSAGLKELASAASSDEPPLPKELTRVEAKASWPKAWDPVLEETYEDAKAAMKSASAGSEAVVRRAARLLAPFARAFRRQYTRRGLVSFDGLLLKARDLVRDQPEVREELKVRFATLLVDEFQDTDPLQGELLLFLSEAPGRAAADWTKVVPGAGRLFVVGDPKQSIYRFRGADIAAYQSFTRHVLAGRGALSCDLVANFRSPAALLEPVNSVFDKLMRAEEGLQASHKPLLAGQAKSGTATGPRIELVAVGEPLKAGEPYDADAVRAAEGAWIAAWLAEHCGPGRGLAYRDAAVLLRTSTPLPALLDAFKAAGIPYAVELDRHFYGAQEVIDFLNLLRVLDDPGDRVALAGLLRSPLGGLDDRELAALSLEGSLDYRKAPSRVSKPADALFALLKDLRSSVGRVPLGVLVHETLQRTRLLELSAAAYHGEQSVSNLLKLARLAAEASGSRGETLREFIERTERETESEGREGESPLADEHLDAVRVLTVHKSKGLEFPVVLLANSGGGLKSGRADARFDWSSGRVGLRAGSAGGATLAALAASEKRREDREAVRLLYVAMTRAKERLIVVGKESGEKGSFAWRLAGGGVWPGGAPGMKASPVAADAVAAPKAEARKRAAGKPLPSEKLLGSLWRARRERFDAASEAKWTRSPTGDMKEKPRPRDEGELPGSSVGALVGKLCHRALETWDFKKPGDAAQTVAAAARALSKLEPASDWPSAQEEAAALLTAFAGSKAARELAGVEIIGRELPFAFGKDGAVLRGSIDLLYRDGRKVVIADYKTDRVDGKSVAAVKKRYESQGAAYRDAVAKAMGLADAEFRLIFLRAPELK